ncbi:hypothetical protein [Spirosoma spitsbergense]|uniref:hypothetical protein n=1 Tax=Spirosoma spitsbergense TaxID=431554 RepID=UPI0012FB7B6A|nr:hypothetical protein [Spirosoma spitsbergense]
MRCYSLRVAVSRATGGPPLFGPTAQPGVCVKVRFAHHHYTRSLGGPVLLPDRVEYPKRATPLSGWMLGFF